MWNSIHTWKNIVWVPRLEASSAVIEGNRAIRRLAVLEDNPGAWRVYLPEFMDDGEPVQFRCVLEGFQESFDTLPELADHVFVSLGGIAGKVKAALDSPA